MTSNGGGISGSDTDDEIVEVECIEYQSLEDTDDEDEVQEEEEVQVVDDEATSSDESSGSDCVILEDGDNDESLLDDASEDISFIKEVRMENFDCRGKKTKRGSKIISSVTSAKGGGGPGTKASIFKHLDMYRCYICRTDYDSKELFLYHRRIEHKDTFYNPCIEKPFACGICGRPWNQPRKALACAVYGHDPSIIAEGMFCHSCPMCRDESLGYHNLKAVARHWQLSHSEKPIPPFLLKVQEDSREFLPQIKLTNEEFAKVNLSMLQADCNEVPLVVDNLFPKITAKLNEAFTVFKCEVCATTYSSESEAQAHQCMDTNGERSESNKKKWTCPYCKCGCRNAEDLKSHLTFSSCNFGGVPLYKCILCGERLHSLKLLREHRSVVHSAVPFAFNPIIESPFACGICGKPALNRKEALVCTLFGHNPNNLKTGAYLFRCSFCPQWIGFENEVTLREHWSFQHKDTEIPSRLKLKVLSNPQKSLPEIHISVAQLMSIGNDPKILMKVEELEPPISLNNYLLIENIENNQEGIAGDNVNGTKRSSRVSVITKVTVDKQGNEITDSTKDICGVCGMAYKDLRRHISVHDAKRKKGNPKYSCIFCNKAYHLRTSFVSHRLKSKSCRDLYLSYKQKEGKYEHGNSVISRENVKAFQTMSEPVLENFEIEQHQLQRFQDDIDISVEEPVRVKNELQQGSDLEDSLEDDLSMDVEIQLNEFSLNGTDEGVLEAKDRLGREQRTRCQDRSNKYLNDDMMGFTFPLHICPVCNKPFKTTATLQRHCSYAHDSTNERSMYKYSCAICKQGFNYPWNLKRHIKSHAQDRIKFLNKTPTPVPKSSHRRKKVTLKKRKKTPVVHEDDMPKLIAQSPFQTCPCCEKPFNYTWSLKRHMNKVHGKM